MDECDPDLNLDLVELGSRSQGGVGGCSSNCFPDPVGIVLQLVKNRVVARTPP